MGVGVRVGVGAGGGARSHFKKIRNNVTSLQSRRMSTHVGRKRRTKRFYKTRKPGKRILKIFLRRLKTKSMSGCRHTFYLVILKSMPDAFFN